MSTDVKHPEIMTRAGVAPGGMVNEHEMTGRVNEILNRHPAVGLAVGVVRNGLRTAECENRIAVSSIDASRRSGSDYAKMRDSIRPSRGLFGHRYALRSISI